MDDSLVRDLAALHAQAFSWALALCRWNRDEAEETLQMTYEKLFDGRARFEGRSSFKTWLFAVVRRTAADRRRRRWLAWFRLRDLPADDPPAEPAALVEQKQRAARVRRALAALPQRQREVLDLVFFHELTVDESAAVMGVSPGTARQHYDRGKRRLGELLGEGLAPLEKEPAR